MKAGHESGNADFLRITASNYTYAEATANPELEHWVGAYIRAFKFLGGVPNLVFPDNTRTGVNRTCRNEPDLNRTYHELAPHYKVGVQPKRPNKPRVITHTERVIRTIIVSCLERMILLGDGSLRTAIHDFITHNHQERNHQGLENRLIMEEESYARRTGAIQCPQRLGAPRDGRPSASRPTTAVNPFSRTRRP